MKSFQGGELDVSILSIVQNADGGLERVGLSVE